MLTTATTRVVHPPKSDLEKLRQPLTLGEKIVFEIFDEALDPEWEIYLQPHLNGLRPDIVLLHPRHGIAVFEIKDWNLDAMHYWVEEKGRDEKKFVELVATKDGKTFKVDNPFRKIRKYKEEIFNVYCPRLARRAGFAAISAGVIFPFASERALLELQRPFLRKGKEQENAHLYWPVIGREGIGSRNIERFMPSLARGTTGAMTPTLAEDLRGWLVEPDLATEQRKPLELDNNQRSLATSRTQSGYRRIKGPAGSGKSLVLAARAADLIDNGQDVLVITYNITLWHYLRDLVVRARRKVNNPGMLTFSHFHKWCKDICEEAGMAEEYAEIMAPLAEIYRKKLSREEEAKQLSLALPPILNFEIPALAEQAARSAKVFKYKAILVDEGQDFQPSWWQALQPICLSNGERILVADSTQDVYDTARSWTDEAMTGAGFPGGRWAELKVSYRLPPDLIPLTQEFARRFLPAESVDLPQPEQGSLSLYPCSLWWQQCSVDDEIKRSVDAILAMMRETGRSTANADITFLTDNVKVGRAVVDELDTYRVRAMHTFEYTKKEERARKLGFFMGDARVKATTFQSFKGWESRLLVLNIGNSVDAQSRAAIYAALTRLKRDPNGSYLTVVCSNKGLADFGETWPTSA